MAKIQVIKSQVVRMASDATCVSRLDLTPWDLRLLQIVYLQRGLIFHKPQAQQMEKNFIDHIRTSLSRTLDFFPPLTGRLVSILNHDGTSTFFVDCNNTGAEFTHAMAANVSVSDILEPKYIPEIINSLFPLNDLANIEGISKPLLAVQVTELADGVFIGCAANHAVVDGTSFWHFVNSWSQISRGLGKISKTPIFDRSILSKVAATTKIDQNPMNKLVPPPLLNRVFHFSKESLSKLKSRANSESGTDKISSFQAISALLWRAVTRAQNQINPESEFAVIVGARSRIGLAEGYFGNAVYTCSISASEREILNNGIGYAALKINELVTRQTRGAAIEDLGDCERRTFFRKMSSFIIIGSPRHDVYSNDFGWGIPIAVRSGKGREFDGKITIFPAAEDGGVDLEVLLATDKMAAVEDDPEFIAALTI